MATSTITRYTQETAGTVTPYGFSNQSDTGGIIMAGRKHTAPINRFQEKYYIDSETGCWLWTGSRNHLGYGQFHFQGKPVFAHRWSYQYHVGEIPNGLELCHKCDTPHCVNPDCLVAGTHQENMEDMAQKGRSATGESHGNSKLKESDVVLIKQFFQRHPVTHQGGQCTFLARWFGVHKKTLSDINNGKYWRHIK